MATHSSVLAWRIPWMGEPGRLQSMGLHRVRHDWSDLAAAAEKVSLKWIIIQLNFKNWMNLEYECRYHQISIQHFYSDLYLRHPIFPITQAKIWTHWLLFSSHNKIVKISLHSVSFCMFCLWKCTRIMSSRKSCLALLFHILSSGHSVVNCVPTPPFLWYFPTHFHFHYFTAGVQPRLIQGIRRRDGVGDLFKC